MLVVQEIVTEWHKNERGGESAEARSRFLYAAPIEGKPCLSDECIFDYKRFYQKERNFYTPDEYDRLMGFGVARRLPKRTYESPVKLSQLKVRNVSFVIVENQNENESETENSVEVSFSYDLQINGKPARRGHNKDYNNIDSRLYGKDILNETAFVLKEGQKGRIMYNGRFTDYDTGQWWYEQTAVNIANISFGNFTSNIFLDSEFDYMYNQLADLR